MFQHVPSAIGCKRVFDSVFPPSLLSGISSNPCTTPISNLPEKSSGSCEYNFSANEPPLSSSELVTEQDTWDRAWRSATAFLAIPDKRFDITDDSGIDDKTLLKQWAREPPSAAIRDCLFYVGSYASEGKVLRKGLKEYDMTLWYTNETRRHFLHNFKDSIAQILKRPAQNHAILTELVRYLRLAQNIYYTPFMKYILPLSNSTAQSTGLISLREHIHAVTTFSLPTAEFSELLSTEFASTCSLVLGLKPLSAEAEDRMDIDSKPSMSYNNWRKEPSPEQRITLMTKNEPPGSKEARHALIHLIEGLQDVGLGGKRIQAVFAKVMNSMITRFIISSYSGEWESPSLAVEHLRLWVGNVFGRLAVQILHCLTQDDENGTRQTKGHLDVTLGDINKWQEIAVIRLAALRISELFDVIVEWDASSGAIEDLKSYTANPATRFYLSNTFNTAVLQRLLHPGASTLEILQLYVSTIRALTQLDPRGVILDRVARPIRRYLRERDDTVKVIVEGLLADVNSADKEHEHSSHDTLVELAVELSDARQVGLQNDSGELDWDDMNWVPDPIDATTEYKRSKSDVIGSLITLFDSKDVFVKELQNSLSQRLLSKTEGYDQEISVLELLKVRFGGSALQACEVMLRDALDSKRIDAVIRADRELDDEANAGIHAKILSRLYWPGLKAQPFKIPDEIKSLQEQYSAGFEALKPSRKLTWLNSLGTATVELDLEDRIFREDVTTWQAAVIYSFHSAEAPAPPISVTEIAQGLDMPAYLVRSACLFWQGKRILVQLKPDIFTVLETLPDDDDSVKASQPHKDAPSSLDTGAAAAAAAAKEAAEADTMAQMDLYWQFIRGMLTNQGAMPLQRIIMMLKIAVPGGFPFSTEELKQFMGKMVSAGNLEMASGGNYKIISQ